MRWQPSIGYQRPFVGVDSETSITEDIAKIVFKAVQYIEEQSPKTYQVLRLFYQDERSEDAVAELLGISRRRVLEYLREGQGLVQYFLLGRVAYEVELIR